MNPKQPDSVRSLAAEAGLSLSQMAQAKKEGVDCKSPPALQAFRARINTRSDSRTDPVAPGSGDGELMTLEDIERELARKGTTPNEARALKTQLEGLKAATALRQQRNQLLPRAECQENQAKIAHGINAFLRKFEKEIPQLCFGHTLAKAKETVREKTRELQAFLADETSAFWNEHKES